MFVQFWCEAVGKAVIKHIKHLNLNFLFDCLGSKLASFFQVIETVYLSGNSIPFYLKWVPRLSLSLNVSPNDFSLPFPYHETILPFFPVYIRPPLDLLSKLTNINVNLIFFNWKICLIDGQTRLQLVQDFYSKLFFISLHMVKVILSAYNFMEKWRSFNGSSLKWTLKCIANHRLEGPLVWFLNLLSLVS